MAARILLACGVLAVAATGWRRRAPMTTRGAGEGRLVAAPLEAACRVRGGATVEAEEAIAPTRRGKKKLLEGGTGSVSVSQQVSDIIERLVRMAKRFLDELVASGKGRKAEAKASKTTAKTTAKTSTVASRKAARIAKELKDFLANPPENCKVTMGKSLNVWVVTIIGAKNTIFEGEKYKLRVAFPADYPTAPPSVYFLQPPPRHPHVYTNGDICLNLLGKDWRPNLTIAQLSLSILSMLSSAKQKGIPQDNAVHAATPPGRPQEGWMYHDDSC